MKTHPDHFLRGPYIIDHTNYASGEAFSDALKQIGEALQETPPLTKREYFAALAMQGLLSCDGIHTAVYNQYPEKKSHHIIAQSAVAIADKLIEELNRKSEG